MARINLLPWREALRKQKQIEFGIMAGLAAAATLVLMGLVHLQIESMIDFQQQRNRMLENEIAAVGAKLKELEELEKQKQRLISRMKIIQDLQQSRPLIVRLFDEMVNTTPSGSHLMSLDLTGSRITLQGVAESNARVSTLIRNAETSDWLTLPDLKLIQKTGEQVYNFGLSMDLKDKNAPVEEQ
jgi:type IV pilus assembly protein PilN